MKQSLLLLLACAAAAPSPAFSGQESHGGSLVLCAGKEPVTLDYYHSTLPVFGGNQPPLMPIEGLSTAQVIDNFRARLAGMPLLEELDRALKKLGPVAHWPLRNLQDVLDSNEPYRLPNECKRVQGAVREGRRVYLDTNFGRRLSTGQSGMLAVHEALFFLSGQKTSEKIRTVIRDLVILDTPPSRLAADIRELGVPGSERDRMLGRLVYAKNSQMMHTDGVFSRYQPQSGDGLKGCAIEFSPKSIDAIRGQIVAEYLNTGNGCDSSAQVAFECALDGSRCLVADGEALTGWSKGCELVPGDHGRKITLRCPGNAQGFIFFRASI